jgi:hypothetical protein
MDIEDDNQDDNDDEDHSYTPVRGDYAGGTAAFYNDVKETLLCYRNYHDQIDEYRDLTYELEEELDLLYTSMVTNLFSQRNSKRHDGNDHYDSSSSHESEAGTVNFYCYFFNV